MQRCYNILWHPTSLKTAKSVQLFEWMAKDAIINRRWMCSRLGEVWILDLIYPSTSDITFNPIAPGECRARFCSLSNSPKSMCSATYCFGLLKRYIALMSDVYAKIWHNLTPTINALCSQKTSDYIQLSPRQGCFMSWTLNVSQFTINE